MLCDVTLLTLSLSHDKASKCEKLWSQLPRKEKHLPVVHNWTMFDVVLMCFLPSSRCRPQVLFIYFFFEGCSFYLLDELFFGFKWSTFWTLLGIHIDQYIVLRHRPTWNLSVPQQPPWSLATCCTAVQWLPYGVTLDEPGPHFSPGCRWNLVHHKKRERERGKKNI